MKKLFLLSKKKTNRRRPLHRREPRPPRLRGRLPVLRDRQGRGRLRAQEGGQEVCARRERRARHGLPKRAEEIRGCAESGGGEAPGRGRGVLRRLYRRLARVSRRSLFIFSLCSLRNESFLFLFFSSPFSHSRSLCAASRLSLSFSLFLFLSSLSIFLSKKHTKIQNTATREAS